MWAYNVRPVSEYLNVGGGGIRAGCSGLSGPAMSDRSSEYKALSVRA